MVARFDGGAMVNSCAQGRRPRYPQPTYPRVAVPIGEISSAVGEE